MMLVRGPSYETILCAYDTHLPRVKDLLGKCLAESVRAEISLKTKRIEDGQHCVNDIEWTTGSRSIL